MNISYTHFLIHSQSLSHNLSLCVYRSLSLFPSLPSFSLIPQIWWWWSLSIHSRTITWWRFSKNDSYTLWYGYEMDFFFFFFLEFWKRIRTWESVYEWVRGEERKRERCVRVCFCFYQILSHFFKFSLHPKRLSFNLFARTHILSLTHSHTHTLSLSLTLTHTLSHSHTHTHTLSLYDFWMCLRWSWFCSLL